MRDAWERFRDLENSCPHHGIQDWMVIKSFFNGLYDNIKINLDSLSGGAFKRLDATRARDLIDECARNYTWMPMPNNRRPIGKQQVHEISTKDARITELEAELAAYRSTQGTQVNYINDGPSYSSKYQFRNQNPPSLYRNVQFNNNNGDQPFERKHVPNDIPIVVQEFMHEQAKFNQAMAKDLDELKANAGALTRIERMMEAHFSRQQGKLPSQPQVNPNAECKSLHSLRSGTQYKDPPMPHDLQQASEQEEPVLEQILPFPPLSSAAATTGAQDGAPEAQNSSPEPGFRTETDPIRSEITDSDDEPEALTKKKCKKSVPKATYMPPLPFPKRLAREKEALLFKRFWEMLKEVNITIPFTDVFTKVPIYAKFLKELCTGKKSLEELKTVALKSKMSPKLSDPGRFTLPCTIGKVTIKQALCDMGASVSLMPRTVFEKIGIGELTPTMMTLQLADSSVRLPLGVLEDVPVCVGKFVVPCDFVVMEMEEDKEVPIILGRPFLRTAGVKMDARDGTILVRVGGEELHFSMDHAMECPSSTNTCFMIKDIKPTPLPQEISDRNVTISDRNLVLQADFKPYPTTVRYEFLGLSQKYPVIANSKLDAGQKKKFLVEKGAMGYSTDDLKGGDPSICSHGILLKDVLTRDVTNEGYDKSLAVSLSGPPQET